MLRPPKVDALSFSEDKEDFPEESRDLKLKLRLERSTAESEDASDPLRESLPSEAVDLRRLSLAQTRRSKNGSHRLFLLDKSKESPSRQRP